MSISAILFITKIPFRVRALAHRVIRTAIVALTFTATHTGAADAAIIEDNLYLLEMNKKSKVLIKV